MVAITGMKFRHAASSFVKKGESTRLDHDTQQAEQQSYCAKRRLIKRTQDPNNRYKAFAAGFDQLFFKKQYKSGKRPKMPAQKYYDYAWVTAQSSNLVIGGATGSGKTVMAWYLAITLQPIFCAFVIQHRRHPQRMNADYATESIPKEWRTRLEAQGNIDDTENTGDQYGCAEPISVNTYVKTVGSNVRFTRESVKKKFSLNFITSGRFPYFFEGPGPLPTAVVLDEIHERCLSNDYAVHALLHLNIQLMSQGRRPIRLMMASASGWQSIVNFLRKEYDLANIHCGAHDFTPVEIAEHLHPITEHFIPYREGHPLNAGDTHADEKKKEAAKIGFEDLFTEIFALLKASSFRYQTQKGSRWHSKPSMSLEKGAITLCFVPGGNPGNDLASEVMKQSVVADTPAGEADYGGEQDHDQLRDPGRVYNHAIATKGKGKGKGKKGDFTKGKSDDSTKGSGKKGGAGPRPISSVEIGRISENEAVPVRAYYLDGKMSGKDIQKVLQPHPDMHKILFVTNFLESSGTVQNVQNIIISGWELRLAYDSMRGTAVLKPVRISWRSYIQQRGRGGRDRPTEVYVLMPRSSQTAQMASIMSNSDEDLSDNILTMARRSPTREIPEFQAQEESEDEGISLREALESCRMVFNEGKRAITVLSRKQVILAIIELKFLGLVTNSSTTLRSRITQYGSLAASFGLRTRYNAMLTHPELRGEKNHRLNDYNPSLFYFMLLSIGVVISAGRHPFVSDHALNKHANRRNEAAREHEEEEAKQGESITQNPRDGDNRYTSKGYKGRPSGGKYAGTSGLSLDSDRNWDLREVKSTYDNSADIKRNRGAKASRHNDHERMIHYPGYAFYLDLGIHINGFLVVHNFIHYHLKKLTFKDQDGEVKPMTNEYFLTKYRARADNEPDYAGRGSLTGFLSRYGIQHKAMYLIIDLMQSVGRMHHIDWLSMPHFGTITQQPADPDLADATTLRDAQLRREKVCDEVMMHIARWSTMNLAVNNNQGNIFTLASGEQVFRRGHSSAEEMKDVQACKYVIFEELSYSKDGKNHFAGFMSGVARTTNADDVKIAAGYFTQRKQLHNSLLEAAKHVNMGLNINHPTKLHFEAVSGEYADDTIYDNPMGTEELARDTDLYEQPNQSITYNAENMAVFDSTSQLKLNEWAYVREKLRQSTNQFHWERCLFEIQKEGNLQSTLGYAVSDHMARDAADRQKSQMRQMGIRGMANSQNSRWWFLCDQCNAMCKVVAGVFPPPHTHDQRFLNQLATEFPDGLPDPVTVDITSSADHRLDEVPMFVDGVNITETLAEQVRQEHIDRLTKMKSKDQYLEQAQEAHRQGVAMPSLDIDNDTHDHRSTQPTRQTEAPANVPKYTYANASHPEISKCIERLNNWSRLIRHRGSSIMVDHLTGRVLLVNFDKHKGTIGRWTFPSGGAKNGETVTEVIRNRKVTFAGAFTAIRESREEAGVQSVQCEGMVIDNETQPRGPIAMTPMLRKRRGTTTYYVFVVPELEAMFHQNAMFACRSKADQRCVRSFQFVQFPYVTFAHCFRDVFPVLTSLYKQHPALLTPKVDLASFDVGLPLPPHIIDRNLGVQDPRVNPAHVDGDSLFDFVKNEGSNQKHLRQSSDWKDLKSDFFALLNAVPPELFARLWREGPNGVFPTESDDPVFSRSSLICQMVFGVTDQMHLMSYKGMSWFGMKTNEDLTTDSQRACWTELVSCAQISMPREGEGPSWEVIIDAQVLQQSPAIQVMLNTPVGAVADPVCKKALEYLDYENKCAIQANTAITSLEAARAVNTTMPPSVEEFVKVFQNSIVEIEDNEEKIMDQECDYTKYAEYLEHLARYKDKDGKDQHGGGNALAKGKPAADLTISLIRTAPRLIRELHTELIKRAHWKSLCIPADGRVKQTSLENNLKNDNTVKGAFRELMQVLRSAFTKAPRWFPEDMKYFLNAVCGGRYKLRGVAGMGPVIDLLINLAWREVWNSREILGYDSDDNPIGVFIPGGRHPGHLAYVEYELQQPWDDMWEIFDD